MAGAPKIFDRDLLIRRRSRALAALDLPDFLLTHVAEDFAERLSAIQRRFERGISLEAYHGVVARVLREMPSIGELIDVEPSRGLEHYAGPRIAAHAEALPFAPASLNLAVSALSLHLVNDLPGALVQLNRALKPDGLLLAALLGGETLRELRQTWLLAETEMMGGASPRVAPFADLRDLGGLMQRAGFSLIVADSETLHVTYASPLALMREIKAMGASNVLVERTRTPVTRRLLFRAAEIYAEKFGLENGRVPATFEILTLTGWVPHASQPKPLAPGSATISLAGVLKPSSRDPAAKE